MRGCSALLALGRTCRLDRIGVDIVRAALRWDQIAVREPRDPQNRDRAYRWRNPDRVQR